MICRLRTYQAVEKNLPTRHFWRIRRPSLCSRVAQKLNMPSTGKKAFPQFLRSHCLLLQGGECYAPMAYILMFRHSIYFLAFAFA
jgi:hypothetical protein